MEFLQQEQLPFLMPVMFRGRKPKKASPSDRAALDQAAGGRLVPAHDEERQTRSHGVGVRRLSHAQEPQGRQTGEAEAAVRRLARAAGLRPRFASATASGSASKPAFGNCGRHGFTPAHANPACGCCSSRWRWCSATCGSGSTTRSWPKATETTARSIWNASASNACWTGAGLHLKRTLVSTRRLRLRCLHRHYCG